MITLIVPVYNEQEVIPLFYQDVREILSSLDVPVEVLFIDDGSQDGSLALIEALGEEDPLVSYVSFSRNFGKEAALFAGLENARGDAVIPMDVDLQDPVELILEMFDKWKQGADVVLAERVNRKTDSFLKRNSANIFYWLHNKIAEDPIKANVGDFRLLDRKVVDALKQLPERKLFMKGVFSWVGFKRDTVTYERPARAAGQSKFHGWRLWSLAVEGFTSFSTWPLRVWTYVGSAIAFFSFAYAVWMTLDKLVNDNPVPGYTSLMVTMLFLGGIQLIGIGILGEYLGRVYYETKQRPRFIIQKSKIASARAYDI